MVEAAGVELRSQPRSSVILDFRKLSILQKRSNPVVQVQNRYSNRGRIHRLLSSIRGDSERAHHHRSSAF